MNHEVNVNVLGRIQDFHLLGGGRKRLCAGAHITSAETEVPFAGVQGPHKGPGSSIGLLMLSCYQSHIF